MKGKFFDKISDNFYKMAPNRLSIASASAMSDFHRESRKEKYRSPRFLTTIEKYQLMLGACRGIAFLHDRGYMHCDIKSPNFLISKVRF
jgi:serine/threonine protein kinase